MRIHLPLPRLQINETGLEIDVVGQAMRIHLPLPKLKINEHLLKIDVFVRYDANPFTTPEAPNQ